MKFTKMQGIGNDYLYINCFEEKVENPQDLARRMSDRHFGAGGDGIVLIGPGGEADFEMRMFNADGSEAEMCGNAARCVGKYVREKGLTAKDQVRLKTGSGIRVLELRTQGNIVESVRVDMGAPELKPEKIPVLLPGDRAINAPIVIHGEEFRMTCVSMGNPHAVIFVKDADQTDVHGLGRELETHPLFPQRTNVEFVSVLKRDELRMRVWERGSGETMACGTGACASLAAGVLNQLCERTVLMRLNGGELRLSWDEKTGHIYQEGPAAFVYEGEWLN